MARGATGAQRPQGPEQSQGNPQAREDMGRPHCSRPMGWPMSNFSSDLSCNILPKVPQKESLSHQEGVGEVWSKTELNPIRKVEFPASGL